MVDVGGAEIRSPRFEGDPHLDAIFAGLELMSFGWVDCSVKKVQQALVELGFDLGPAGVDGVFGNLTHAAVVGFQTFGALVADGIVGPLTLRSLELSVPPVSAQPVDCGDGGGTGQSAPGGGGGVLTVMTFAGDEFIGDVVVAVRSVSDPTARFGTTDASGRLDLGSIPARTYEISADKASFGSGTTSATVDEGAVVEVFVELIRQGQSREPAVFGVRTVSATRRGESVMLSPRDEALGITLEDHKAIARAQAHENARAALNDAVEAEEQRLIAEHPGVTLRFRTENLQDDCTEPSVVSVNSEGEGAATVVIQTIEGSCTSTVQLVFESDEPAG